MPASSAPTYLLLAACLGLGVVLGLAGLAAGFEHLPSDLRRLQTIGEALDRASAGHAPAAIVLGSSVVMNGVDAAVVAEAMGGGAVWNLSSSGQTLAESAVLLDRADPLPPVVVLTALPAALVLDRSIPPNAYVAYRLYGYHPSASLRATIAAGGDVRLLAWMRAPRAVVVARGRWALRASFDTLLRQLLGMNNAEQIRLNLTYPVQYTQPVPPATLRRLLRRYDRPRPAEAGRLAPRATGLLRFAASAARDDGACLVLAVLPEHPRRRATTAPAFYDRLSAELAAFSAAEGVAVVDFSALFDDPALFNDHSHPGARGAARLSRALGHAVARACPAETAR